MKKQFTLCVLLLFLFITSLYAKYPAMRHQGPGAGHPFLPFSPEIYQSIQGELPTTTNSLFAGSGVCAQCHASQVDEAGKSISIVNDWRSTMMANSARDPFWRAKVSHEGLVNPDHRAELENVCTRCHAPSGNENAHYNGQELYSVADMAKDPLALDGVQCTVCHQIPENSLGNFSGTFLIGTNKTIWGPYPNPVANPMINMSGFTPVYSEHIGDSRICASCHTLITQSVDNAGQATGNQFVEQSLFQEWENSDYPTQNLNCQDCHMPSISDPVAISSRPMNLAARTPFNKHHFQGANVFMQKILKDNAAALSLTASDVQFDSTLARTLRLLQKNALDLQLEIPQRTEDTLFVQLRIHNKAGHKLPGGYPSRRMFVEFIVSEENGTILFHSGKIDANGQLPDEDESYEPHHNLINNPREVQIYQLVMGDVNHQVTTVLERANFALKDNRIPPDGFKTNHFAYDTVPIVGKATADTDFNKEEGAEGSGADVIHYHVPVSGSSSTLTVTARVYYQTVSLRWLEHMFGYSSAEIDQFKSFYASAEKMPVLMGEKEMKSFYTKVLKSKETAFQLFPNPTASGHLQLKINQPLLDISIFRANGWLVNLIPANGLVGNFGFDLPTDKGIYLIRIRSRNATYFKKILNN
jgi:hypothetical protein